MTREEAIEAMELLRILDAPGLSEAVKIAIGAMRSQQTGGWISVKDRLPKGGEEVFLLNSYGRAGVGERYKGKWIEYGCEGKAYFRKESYITHWMAVPKSESVLDIGQE